MGGRSASKGSLGDHRISVERRNPGWCDYPAAVRLAVAVLLAGGFGAIQAEETYYPPPESKGGWRMLEKAEEIRMTPSTILGPGREVYALPSIMETVTL